jgi:phytoene synthase
VTVPATDSAAEKRLQADDVRASRRLLREGSKSFYAASLLLPPRVRDDAGAVYAWCRVADHAVDHSDRPAEALGHVRAGLERIYAARPEGSVERAFADAAYRNQISRDIPEAMLEGFQWDADGRTYATMRDVLDYCARVGSTVGVMMSAVMGSREPATVAAACRLGAAMQLTNIARDVGEDARAGRLYLPRERLPGFDVEAWLEVPAPTEPIRAAVQSLLDDADALYAGAWPGIGALPPRCRPAIRAAALVYADIGREIRAAGYDTVGRRAWTSRSRKGRLLLQSLQGSPGAWARSGEGVSKRECLDMADASAAFLVEAAC